jgi:hypothetical protein
VPQAGLHGYHKRVQTWAGRAAGDLGLPGPPGDAGPVRV